MHIEQVYIMKVTGSSQIFKAIFIMVVIYFYLENKNYKVLKFHEISSSFQISSSISCALWSFEINLALGMLIKRDTVCMFTVLSILGLDNDGMHTFWNGGIIFGQLDFCHNEIH